MLSDDELQEVIDEGFELLKTPELCNDGRQVFNLFTHDFDGDYYLDEGASAKVVIVQASVYDEMGRAMAALVEAADRELRQVYGEGHCFQKTIERARDAAGGFIHAA